MKTILRRKSHGDYIYRTTDADGEQALWMRKPQWHGEHGLWSNLERWCAWAPYEKSSPTKRAKHSLVRIVTAKRVAK